MGVGDDGRGAGEHYVGLRVGERCGKNLPHLEIDLWDPTVTVIVGNTLCSWSGGRGRCRVDVHAPRPHNTYAKKSTRV